ncbi:MAG: urea ABC transporter permease subunit UrtB [Methylobacter sp.]|nr:urea ABC transporter permease subunit UrtB [Methylobacter sp.]
MKKKRSVRISCLLAKLFSLVIFISSASFADSQISQEIKTGSEAIAHEEVASTFENLVNQFKEGDFNQKMEVINQITLLKDKRARLVFQSLLNDRLFYSKDVSQRVYSGETTPNGYRMIDVTTGQVIGEVNQDSVTKIKINNRLRKMLRTSLAQLDMTVKDPDIRLKAVKSIGNDLNEDTVKFLRTVLPLETDNEVRTAIKASLAMVDLHADDLKVRLDAIKSLSVTMDSEYNTELKKLVDKDSAGNYLEQDQRIIEAATNAIKKIESRVSFYEHLQTLFFGLSLGSVLVLAAIGLAITFGVMGVINMAHGELIMLGAYTTYVVQLLMPNHIDISLFIAIPAAFAVSGLFGILIERGVIRFLYGRPLETLLATFGISLVLQQLVRTVFSPLNRSVTTPSWMSGSLEINSVLTLTLNRLYIVGFTLLVFLILLAVLKKTRLGLEVRAVSQNRAMAKAMGIKTEWVDAMTFGLGSGIAGVAGVALSQLTNVGPNLGQTYIIDSFMVVVFGGVGNLWGAMISGLSLGLANKFLEPYAGAVLAKILVLIFIILFIQKRPRGLFPQKGRAAEG